MLLGGINVISLPRSEKNFAVLSSFSFGGELGAEIAIVPAITSSNNQSADTILFVIGVFCNTVAANLVDIFVPVSARIIDRHRLRSYDVSIKQITGGFHMDALKKDAIMTQKKGLPFIMASVVIWMFIFFLQLGSRSIKATNMLTFMSSCLLMPLAFFFSKIVKADIFQKTDNPINKMGFLCTMNQMLYILIVMWAFSQKPDAMMMLYAMVFGAHLLPFGWLYNSRGYTFASITETIGALVIATILGNAAAAAFMVVMEALLTILLILELRKETQTS
jgi:hypothetical protein